MQKLWKVTKIVVFSWGALTLALIIYALLSSFVAPVFKSHKHQEKAAAVEEVIFEKQYDEHKLVVKRKETEGPDAYLVSLSKGNKNIIQNYRLPTQKYHLEFVRFYDASLVPGRDNEYRIILYSASEEGECNTDSQIWFLKMTDKMNIREVITLSDVHEKTSGGLVILGNKSFSLPYQDGFHYAPFVVPVRVTVGDSIAVSPLLSPAGIDALHTALEQEIKARMEKPSKNKEEKLGEQYHQVSREFEEALSDKVISY